MSAYIFDNSLRQRSRYPHLISLWSGYCSASLIVSAFVLLNDNLKDRVVPAFGALAFAAALGVSLGVLFGRMLAKRRLHAPLLAFILALAAFMSLIPIACGDKLVSHVIRPGWEMAGSAPVIASLLFVPPLLLLSALPPYATAIIIRSRGRAGTADRTISLCTMLGYCAGALMAASYLSHWSNAVLLLEALLALSLLVASVTAAKHASRKRF